MLIIVGLGNPDKKYSGNYHNIGYMAVSDLASKLGLNICKKACQSHIAEKFLPDNDKVVLALPLTYMNNSGDAVKELMGKYKAKSTDIVVVYDDIDLPVGQIRIRKEGSAGTHNGMKSIVNSIGTKEFLRIRIGIGRPADIPDLKDFVLMNIRKEDREILTNAIDSASDALKKYIETKDADLICREYSK